MNFSEVNAKISVSQIHGVGVIALRNIKKGCILFQRRNDLLGVWVKESQIPIDILQHVTSFCPAVHIYGQRMCFVPKDGFNAKDISFFMNHSLTPNVEEYDSKRIDSGDSFTEFRAATNISKGEELTINYNSFSVL